jgi:hypothetical protein
VAFVAPPPQQTPWLDAVIDATVGRQPDDEPRTTDGCASARRWPCVPSHVF